MAPRLASSRVLRYGSAMTTIVNLNRFRKRRARAADKRRAAENRVRFGRGKTARASAERERERAATALDGKRLELAPGDEARPENPAGPAAAAPD
jgi:hypothetical protein